MLVNIKTDPIIVDMTRPLCKEIGRQTKEDLLPEIVSAMEKQVCQRSVDENLQMNALPTRYDDMLYRWRNWPKVKDGPAFGFVNYSAIFTVQDEKLALLMTLPEEGKRA